MEKKVGISTIHEVYVGTLMVGLGFVGVLWKMLTDFPSLLILGAGLFILANELYHRVYNRGLEYYFPALYNILFRESLFDLAFNQNHITRFIRMMSRFAALIVMRDLSDQSTKEILDGIDDAFIHRLFSPGVLSMVRPSVEKDSFPIDRQVALAIIKERRIHPFKRPDMPYPVGVTANRLLTPYVAGSVSTFSLALSGVMWKYYADNSKLSLIPATTGTLLSSLLLVKNHFTKRPHFQKRYPQFPFRLIVGGIDPIAIAIICKYRKFYH